VLGAQAFREIQGTALQCDSHLHPGKERQITAISIDIEDDVDMTVQEKATAFLTDVRHSTHAKIRVQGSGLCY
jgi:hypothetical protein